jgi:hypothetical protein
MFTNLAAQEKLPYRPLPTFRKPVLQTAFPTEADVRGFLIDFSNAASPKAWLEDQGVGEVYSKNVVDAYFLQTFTKAYLANTALWQNDLGDQYCELMRDLCNLAQRAGVR